MTGFPPHPEEVVLVIEVSFAFGGQKEASVIVMSVFGSHVTAAESQLIFGGPPAQKRHCFTCSGFGQPLALHAESG